MLPREGNGSYGKVVWSLKGHHVEDGASLSTEGQTRGNALAMPAKRPFSTVTTPLLAGLCAHPSGETASVHGLRGADLVWGTVCGVSPEVVSPARAAGAGSA